MLAFRERLDAPAVVVENIENAAFLDQPGLRHATEIAAVIEKTGECLAMPGEGIAVSGIVGPRTGNEGRSGAGTSDRGCNRCSQPR